MVLDSLPGIAAEVAAPLARTDTVIVLSGEAKNKIPGSLAAPLARTDTVIVLS